MSSPGASKQYRMERERREREALAERDRTRLKRAAAKHTMALWNAALVAGWRTIFYPSVGTALTTGCNWLHVVCPACQQIGETDLRKIDIHPQASLGAVVRSMSCRRCSPHPPFARPLGATRRSWDGKDKWRQSSRHLSDEEWRAFEGNPFDAGPGWAQNQIAAGKKRP